MLPLVVILAATAIKDGVEDHRRSTLDDEVNNSAATKLGGWRNVNQLKDPRTYLEKLLGVGSAPDRVTKGVRKLREKEAAEGKNIVLVKLDADGNPVSGHNTASSLSLSDSTMVGGGNGGGRQRSLEDIMSVASNPSMDGGSHSYPPTQAQDSFGTSAQQIRDSVSEAMKESGANFGTVPAYSSTTSFRSSARSMGGVVDWNRQVPGTARWERTLWKKLDVGDIVLLRENDQIPADIVVLSTSDADGVCYVETKNLDGETNLKPRKSLKATSTICSEEDLEHSAFILDSEPPHANLYNYNGVIRYRAAGMDEMKVEPVTINEMLLRGCSVRNTNWIIGLVVFTGADTKIMLNGGDTPSKRSKIEKETNFNVIMNFIILIIMIVLTAIINGWYDAKSNTSAAFYEIDADVSSSPALNAIVTGV